MGNTCTSDRSTVTASQNGSAPHDKSQTKDTGNDVTSDKGYPKTHSRCRGGTYPRDDDVLRFPVSDDKVTWDVDFEDYEPMEFFATIDVPIEEDKNFRLVPLQ